MGSEKMSKSLGNVTLVHDLLKDWDGEVIRLALLKAHYRSELNWSEDLLKESKAQLDGWYKLISFAQDFEVTAVTNSYNVGAFFDNLNTPHAFGVVKMLRNAIMHPETMPDGFTPDSSALQKYKYEFFTIMNLLGLLQKDPDEWFKGGEDTTKIDALVAEYDAVRAAAMTAKAAGDKAAMGAAFARSDELREQFKADGIVLETGVDGSKWRKG